MGRPSSRSLRATFRAAIPEAIADRRSLIDAYSGEGPEAEEAQELITAFQALGKALDRVGFRGLSPEERETARLVLLYAEQNETSYADSQPGARFERSARAAAARYRAIRHARWGRTQLEAIMADATPVSLDELRRRMVAPNANGTFGRTFGEDTGESAEATAPDARPSTRPARRSGRRPGQPPV